MVIYFGLGSNLGDRHGHLRDAVSALARAGLRPLRSASIYLTEPWGAAAGQPSFFNTVIEAECDISPLIQPALELMDRCLSIERDAGRIRSAGNDPRVIDIDILYIGSMVVQTPGLIVPHPRIAERRFVLTPLAEIAPEFTDPRRGLTVLELLRICTDTTAVTLHDAPLF